MRVAGSPGLGALSVSSSGFQSTHCMVCIVAYLQRRKEKQLRGYTNDSSSSRPAYEVVPFLSVARSLGDFWSYNVEHDNFCLTSS